MTDEPFYDEVWCSSLDEAAVKKKFTSSPVVPKSFVPMKKIFLVKKDGVSRQPGFVDYENNIIVLKMELR